MRSVNNKYKLPVFKHSHANDSQTKIGKLRRKYDSVNDDMVRSDSNVEVVAFTGLSTRRVSETFEVGGRSTVGSQSKLDTISDSEKKSIVSGQALET